MKVFVFDLLAYDANLDHLKDGARAALPAGQAAFRCRDRGAHL